MLSDAEEYADVMALELSAWEYLQQMWVACEHNHRDAEMRVRLKAKSSDDPIWHHAKQTMTEIDLFTTANNSGLELLSIWEYGVPDKWITAHVRLDDNYGLRTNAYSATYLLTGGGPHAEVEWVDGDSLEISVTWGSHTAKRYVVLPNVSENMRAYCDRVTGRLEQTQEL